MQLNEAWSLTAFPIDICNSVTLYEKERNLVVPQVSHECTLSVYSFVEATDLFSCEYTF